MFKGHIRAKQPSSVVHNTMKSLLHTKYATWNISARVYVGVIYNYNIYSSITLLGIVFDVSLTHCHYDIDRSC